ncbi:hypothetical protein F2S74_15465 [Pseudomonas syringae pv. actinidiae]|nr:hypothetical protein [Pseudomonas syringae pv. actinidiae]
MAAIEACDQKVRSGRKSSFIQRGDGPTTAHNELVGVTPPQKTAFAQASTCQPTAADLRSNRVTYWPLFSSPDTATGRVYNAMNL